MTGYRKRTGRSLSERKIAGICGVILIAVSLLCILGLQKIELPIWEVRAEHSESFKTGAQTFGGMPKGEVREHSGFGSLSGICRTAHIPAEGKAAIADGSFDLSSVKPVISKKPVPAIRKETAEPAADIPAVIPTADETARGEETEPAVLPVSDEITEA